MPTTAEVIQEHRLARMRAGQNVAEPVGLLSLPDVRIFIVPLTEAEFMEVLEEVSRIPAPADFSGMQVRDRRHTQAVVVRAAREPEDYSKRVWQTIPEMMQMLEVADVDEIFLRYQEMTALASPSLDGIPPEEFENLREAFLRMDWNALSGRAWFAFKHFLSLISPSPLLDNSPGFGSTNSSIGTSE